MVTFAQAQERAEEWINGDVPAYQHREVRVREFGLGFVVWAEDRAAGPVSGGGRQRLVIARDSGEVTLWPGLPVGEVIRRYEEEYGAAAAPVAEASVPTPRIDSEQTSFMLSPPEWLQEAADRAGIPPAPAPQHLPLPLCLLRSMRFRLRRLPFRRPRPSRWRRCRCAARCRTSRRPTTGCPSGPRRGPGPM